MVLTHNHAWGRSGLIGNKLTDFRSLLFNLNVLSRDTSGPLSKVSVSARVACFVSAVAILVPFLPLPLP